MKVSLLYTVHVSLTRLLFYIAGEAPDMEEDDDDPNEADQVSEGEEAPLLHLSLSEDSEAGDGTIGGPVLASTPQRSTVASLGVPQQGAVACPSWAPSAADPPLAIAPPSGAQPTGVETASSPQSASAAASSSGLGSLGSHNTSALGPDTTCHCGCQSLGERVKVLEDRVRHLMQRQEGAGTPKTPRGVPATLTTSAQKHEHVAKLGKSGKVFGEF